MLSHYRHLISNLGLAPIKRLSLTRPSGDLSYLVKNKSRDDLVKNELYILKHSPNSRGGLSSFALNAITSSKADNKYIHPIEAIYQEDGKDFAIYKKLPFSLAQVIESRVNLEYSEIFKIIQSVFGALKFLGQEPLLLSHNNLKPENILCDNTCIEKAEIFLSDITVNEKGYSVASLSQDLINLGYIILKLLSPRSHISTLGESIVFFDHPERQTNTQFSQLKDLTLKLIDTHQHEHYQDPERVLLEFIPHYFQPESKTKPPITPKAEFINLLVENQTSETPNISSNFELFPLIKDWRFSPSLSKITQDNDLSPEEKLNFMRLHHYQTASDNTLFEIACLIIREKIDAETESCLKRLHELVHRGHAGACNILAQCYLSDYGGLKNQNEAPKLLQKGLALNPTPDLKNILLKNLSLCYKHGTGLCIDKAKAESLLSQTV